MALIRNPKAILALLTALNFINYLDRFVLSAVLPAVEDELHLSHTAGGLLATLFLVGYFATSPIFGTLADRQSRKGLMALGVALWSLATFASGLATGTHTLMLARAFVGVGEASYATIAPTLIDDLAPPEKKGRWLAIFYVATPVGSALGYLVGGFLGHAYGWRSAFFAAGLPGLLLAALCLLIQEPARKLSEEKPDPVGSAKKLLALPLYRQGVAGYCLATFAIGGFAFWAPTFLLRNYGLDLATANFRFGIVTVLAGIIGTVVGGAWADRRTVKRNEANNEPALVRNNLHVSFVGNAIGAPFALAAFLAPTPTVFFLCTFLCETGIFLSSSPVNTVILRSVPSHLRASAMALSILAIHLFGDLWSPPLMGWLMDHVSVRAAMMLVPLAFAVSAVVWYPKAAKRTEPAAPAI